MEKTSQLELPYILPSQAHKHGTHIEAIRTLDTLVQLSTLSAKLNEAPVNPAEGDPYIIADDSTGE